MSFLYKFVLDETNSLLKVYNDDVFLVDVPFGTHSSAVVVDTFFSVPYLDGTYVDIIFSGTALEFQNYSFDLSGLFSEIEVGTYFDVAVWDSPTYTTELFYVSKGVDGTYVPQTLNETYMTFDTVSGVSSGLTYVSAPASATCDLTLITPEFDEIDLQVATLHSKMDSLHQKADYLVTVLGQVYTLEQTLATKTDLQSITIDTSALATKDDISVLSHYDVTNITLPSLNGNGTEFKDGSSVVLFGRETVYTVERSYMSLYSDNAYTVHYDLVSVDGYKCSVPEALLTKHVTAV